MLLLKWISRSAHLAMLWFSSPNGLSVQTGFSFDETKLDMINQTMQGSNSLTVIAEMQLAGLEAMGAPQ